MIAYLKNLRLFIFIIIFSTFSNAQNIIINEIVSSNSTVNTDEDGNYQDWIELYNSGSQDVNLNDYGLSDDSSPFKWTIPNVNLPSGAYILIWCSDKNRTDPSFPLHTNFKISSSGETITLTSPLGIIVDEVPAVSIPSNFSFGKDTTGSYSFYPSPTPGAVNLTQENIETLSDPIFSVSSGFYSQGFSLKITHTDPNATIIYSIDGSEPTIENLNGKSYFYKDAYQEFPGNPDGSLIENKIKTINYTIPIKINDRTSRPNKISSIPTAYFNFQYYIPTTPILKGTVIRAKAVKDGAVSSRTITKNYYIKPEAENTFTLPVVAINLDENLLFDYEKGIEVPGKDFDEWRASNSLDDATYANANYKRSGDDWEVKGNFSYFLNGNEILNQDIGIRINGGFTRMLPNKSLRLYARSEYGNGSFNYPFFSDLSDKSFKRLILRNSGNDAYSTYFRDAFIHKTVGHLNFDTQAYQPAVVFLNGEYWGLLNLRERYDKYYFKRVYGIEEAELDFLESNGYEVNEGDNYHYTNMLYFIENNSLALQENYNYITTQLDPENFIDYFSTEIFIRNTDWPGNNIEFFRKRTTTYEPNAPYGNDGRWRWILKDTDFGFGNIGGEFSYLHDTLAFATFENETDAEKLNWSTFLLRKLLENNEFKNQFINRFADLMNTTFLPDRVKSIIEEMKMGTENEIGAHRQRWNDGTISQWNTEIETMKTFADKRPEQQRNHIIQKFAINSTINATLDVSTAEQGFIKINTIEIKNGTPSIVGSPYPWTGVYFEGIPVKLNAIALPGFKFSHWSGATNSKNQEIIITPIENFSVQAHFVAEGEIIPQNETIYFWLMDKNIVNDTPLKALEPTFETAGTALLQFNSCLIGYPFAADHSNWGKATMERRNSPSEINYRPQVNNNIPFADANMRAIQIKQPFQQDGLENNMLFNISTKGYKNIKFAFAAKDEGAANAIILEYALNAESPVWLSLSTFTISNNFALFTADFSDIIGANKNPNFAIRLRFSGIDMTADNGNRVTFNNISVEGTAETLSVNASQLQTLNLYPNPFEDFVYLSDKGKVFDYNLYAIEGKLIKSGDIKDGKLNLQDLTSGIYLLKIRNDEGKKTVKLVKK